MPLVEACVGWSPVTKHCFAGATVPGQQAESCPKGAAGSTQLVLLEYPVGHGAASEWFL